MDPSTLNIVFEYKVDNENDQMIDLLKEKGLLRSDSLTHDKN